MTKEELLKDIVFHQALLESLWPLEPTSTEFILSSALRHLHAVIEDDFELAKIYKNTYWDSVESR